MMPSSRPEPLPASRLIIILTGASLLVAITWLVSRVWLGLDFTDEMLYYGEIAGLTRTGRFFQDDLSVQQLGYLFVFPFFKLHSLIYPDQSYLVLFGRLLLLAGYFIVGAVFWRAAARLGGFSTTQKLTGLAAFFAWVPFQIFAFSYNTTSYLLSIALVAGWITRDPGKYSRYALKTAALLTVLTYTYPTAGLVLILVAVVEADRRLGRRAALELLGATALFGGVVLGVFAKLQGPGLLQDLQATVNYTRGFGLAAAIRAPEQFASWLTLVVISGCFLWRRHLGRAFRYPLGLESPPVIRWVALAGFVTGGGALLGLVMNWKTGYFGASVYLGLLMVLAASVGRPDGQPPALRADNRALFRGPLVIALTGGSAALLVIGLRWGTGYYATAVFMLLLTLLATFAGSEAGQIPAGLVVIGTVLGSVFSFTSSNGVHNFGVGAAGVIPFLFLYGARAATSPGANGTRGPAWLALPALVCLLLLNGVLHPYREQRVWNPFKPVVGVPAFKGLWTSPVKIEAVERFQALSGPGALQGKRLLVIGPQPWLYFVLGGQPATPMFFMLYAGNDESYDLVAERLFRDGMPDAVLLTDLRMPRQIAAQLGEWGKRDYAVQRITLPDDFIHRYEGQTGVGFSPEVLLLSRGTAGVEQGPRPRP